MYPDPNLRTRIARSLSLMLLAASLVSCNLVNPFSSSSASTPALGSVTITASNVSKLVKAWNDTLGGTVQFSTAPTVADGMIYIGSVDHHTDGSETGTLYALDAVTGNKRWSLAISSAISTAPFVADRVVYIGSVNYTKHTSALEALDAKTGTKLWSYIVGTTSLLSDPTVANGAVYIVSGGDTLDALDARTGTNLWSKPIGDVISTAPIVADGVVYIASANYTKHTSALEALDTKMGSKLWSYTVGTSDSLTTPIVADRVVYIGSANYDEDTSALEALDAKTGSKLWSYSVGASSDLTAPIVANGIVYIGSWGHALDALDTKTGTKLWSYDMEASDAPLAVANGVVYIDSQYYGKLSALDAKSGARLWIYFTGGSLKSSLIVTNTMVYVNSRKTLYTFAVSTRQAPTPTATSSSLGATTTQRLAPTINKAPVYADVPGLLHIQSMDGLQCPLLPLYQGVLPFPSDDLVFTTGRLTYSKDEIKQIRNYLHEMIYGSESIATSHTLAPPPTLHWISGSTVCSFNLEISNTGNSSVQISSLGVQLLSAPQPNSSQSLHTLDFCSVADQHDADALGCNGGFGSGGGACGGYTVNIALKAAPAASIFAETPDQGPGGTACFEPTLHPNDTLDIEMDLSSPGTKQGTVASYIYAFVPVLTVTDANGSHTFTLSSMAGIAAFVNRQQITCYGLLHDQDTTFVPIKKDTSPPCLA